MECSNDVIYCLHSDEEDTLSIVGVHLFTASVNGALDLPAINTSSHNIAVFTSLLNYECIIMYYGLLIDIALYTTPSQYNGGHRGLCSGVEAS